MHTILTTARGRPREAEPLARAHRVGRRWPSCTKTSSLSILKTSSLSILAPATSLPVDRTKFSCEDGTGVQGSCPCRWSRALGRLGLLPGPCWLCPPETQCRA